MKICQIETKLFNVLSEFYKITDFDKIKEEELIALCYLIEWKSFIETGTSILNLPETWKVGLNGAEPDKHSRIEILNAWERVKYYKNKTSSALTLEEIEWIDHISKIFMKCSYTEFFLTVKSTHPMLKVEYLESFNIKEMAKEYKGK